MNKYKPYIIGITIGVILTITFGLGGYVVAKKSKAFIEKVIVKLSDMRFSNIKKATEEFVIADFETPEDFKKFKDSNVDYEVSKDFVSQGRYCAKVIFKKSQAPSFRIGEYFENNKSFLNWAPYGNFLFDIYNPSDLEERLILQIKDRRGGKYKQVLYLEPKTKEIVEVEISSLRHDISVYNIAQINLFRWQPESDVVFYIDYLRLVPQGTKNKKTIFDPEFVSSKESIYAKGDYFSFPKEHWQKGDIREFPIFVLNPNPIRVKDFPMRGGIPFPRGELKSKDVLAIKDSEGQVFWPQTKVMAKWDDGSIKWLLLDMPLTAEANSSTQYFADYPLKKNSERQNTFVSETLDQVIVDTGKVKFSISRKAFRLFDKVWIGGKEIVSSGSDLILQFRKNIHRSSNDKDYILSIEEAGPFVVGLKAEGWFVDNRGRKFCRFLTRIKAYKNESFVRVYHTFIYTGYPENKYHYLYNGMRLPKNETIEEVSLEMRVPEVFKGGVLTFAGDTKVIQAKNIDEKIRILQTKDDHFDVLKNEKEKIGEGNKLEGWVDFANGEKGVCAIVRKLWQQYPKGFKIDVKTKLLKIKLWPQEVGDLDLKTTERALGPESVARGSAFGLAKTHELVFYFYEGDYKQVKVREMAKVSQQPPLIMGDSEWLDDTKALGALASYKKSVNYFKKYEDCIERLFDWGDRQWKTFKWYGMIDFGDVLTDYGSGNIEAKTDESGWYRDGRWGWFNCSVMSINLGCLQQFLRTGKYKYFEFGEDMARHILDIDTCHYNTIGNDNRLKRRIFDDYSQVGSMHSHNADQWSGRNEVASYTNLNGILLYYYITGYDRAFDVAKEVGEFFLRHPITYFKHSDIAPGRALGNILWGEVALYEATGDERFKKDADYWADLLFKYQNRNGSWNEDYNPQEKRWDGEPHVMYLTGYIMQSLIEYHKLSGNKAIANSIINLTNYLMKHNEYYPFFDGLAYSYYLTGDKKYLDKIEEMLEYFESAQRKQDDPLWNGMIFQKLTYTRMAYFIYSMPYAFEALLSSQNEKNEGKVSE